MANFLGGSAPAMAAQVADGFILLSAATLKGLAPSDLATLRFELERLLRDTRAIVPPQDDASANQARNRRIGRLSSAVTLVGHQMTVRR
jgi:hypothetical protein